jgi:hypothetical protein
MVYKYNIDDFLKISNLNYEFKLHNEILNNIKYISDKINDPKYTRLPQFKKKKYNNTNYKKTYNKNYNNIDLNILRNYKKTIINNIKNGTELHINNIKNLLNKLSKDTYINTINDLDIEIKNVLNLYADNLADNLDDNLDNILNTLSNTIFKICSSNKFYSVLYSELYSYLYDKYDFIKINFNKHYNDSIDKYKNFNYINPDENYDKYCENNITNDMIKSYYIFFVNLVNNNIFEIDVLFQKILYIQNYIFELINSNIMNNKNIINELSDLLFNIITTINTIEKYNKNEKMKLIKNNINKIIKLKSNNMINNNIIFKHLDILDKLS